MIHKLSRRNLNLGFFVTEIMSPIFRQLVFISKSNGCELTWAHLDLRPLPEFDAGKTFSKVSIVHKVA